MIPMNRILDITALVTGAGGVAVAVLTVHALASLELVAGLGGIVCCAVLLRTSSQLALAASVRDGAAR
jgi:hypothetical protein